MIEPTEKRVFYRKEHKDFLGSFFVLSVAFLNGFTITYSRKTLTNNNPNNPKTRPR